MNIIYKSNAEISCYVSKCIGSIQGGSILVTRLHTRWVYSSYKTAYVHKLIVDDDCISLATKIMKCKVKVEDKALPVKAKTKTLLSKTR